MQAPGAAALLDACDAGSTASVAQRALLLLHTVRPEPLEELSRMPLGWVTVQLLRLREALFGPVLDCLANCRQCETVVETRIEVERLTALGSFGGVVGTPEQPLQQLTQRTEFAEYLVEFRLPTYGDLLEMRGDPREAARKLSQALIDRASLAGQELTAAQLPPEVLSAVERAVVERDPLAHIELALVCPTCGARWSQTLQVVDFVWTEVTALAQRWLGQIVQLAHAFGWREADVLAMSEQRRRRYLELVSP